MRLEPFDQDKIHLLHTSQEVRQVRLSPLDFMQQSPAPRRGDQHLVCAREAMTVAVLARLIHIETMMRVLYGGHGQTRRAQQRQQCDK